MNTKLHLGCGKKYLSGYIHIDCDNLPHLDYISTMDDLSMFEDETVDEIYTCGAFHYFDRIEAIKVLKEWRRVLRKDGDLRISLGDFEKIVQVYLSSGKTLEARGILGPLFGRWPIRRSDGTTKCIYQKTAYDFTSLKKMLEDNGFGSVDKYDWKTFLPEGYDDYSKAYIPHMDEKGLLLSLNVYSRKV
jgi:predicted SAM-dependent methyltransferase